MKKIFIVFLFAVIGLTCKSYGIPYDGHNCESAVTINPTDTVKQIIIPVTDSIYWVKFVATDTSIYLYMHLIVGDTSFINQMILFNAPDNCNSYTQVSNINGIYLHYGNLIIGNTYLLKLVNNSSNIISNKLVYYKGIDKAQQSPSPWVFGDEPPPDTLCMGTKILIDTVVLVSGYTIYTTNTYPIIVGSNDLIGFDFKSGCGDYFIQIKFQDLSGTQIATYNGYVTCDPDFTYTSNCTTYNFTASTCVTAPYLAGMLYYWDFGDDNGNVISTDSIPYAAHIFTNTGIDTVTLYIGYIGGGLQSISKIITVNSPAQIQFNLPNPYYIPCSGEYLVIEASLPASIGNLVYNWYASDNSLIIGNTSVIGGDFSDSVTFKVIATDTSSGCLYIGYFVIKIKQPIEFTIIPTSLCYPSQAINLYVPYFPNITYLWNTPSGTQITSTPDTINNININWNNQAPDSVYVFGKDSNGCIVYQGKIWIDTITFSTLPIHPISQPILNGNFNNCDTITTYTANYPNGTSNFTWNVVNDVDTTIISDSSISVHWNSFPNITNENPGLVTVSYIDTNGCISSSSIVVFPCCTGKDNSVTIHDTVIYLSEIAPYKSYNINGVVSIDTNLTLDHNTFIMGPQAKIYVAPGVQFNIDKYSVLLAGCEYMWDGIYVDTTSATIAVKNNSTIQWAINGLVSTNGGVITLNNANMIQNYYNVKISNALAVNYGGSFISTTFKGTTSLPWPPLVGYKTYSGINCDSIHYITIGNSAFSNYKNTFNNMQYGIYAINSTLNVINNQFESIAYQNNGGVGSPFNFYYEGAIYAMHTKANSNPNYLKVGGDGLKTNIFKSCVTGIHSFEYVNNLDNNQFYDGNVGISLLSPSAGTVVHRNFITQSNNNTFNTYSGITIQNPFTTTICSVSVDSNTIYNQATGIYMLGLYSTWKGSSIQNNTISNLYSIYTNSFPNQYYGMDIEYCNKLRVSNNTVHYYPYTNLDSAQSLTSRGISIYYTQGAILHSNYFDQLGSGIYTGSNLMNTQFECNNFYRNYYGLQFENGSTISNQGKDSVFNPANTWTDYYSTDRAHKIGPLANPFFNYYYVSGDYLPSPNNLPGILIPFLNSTNANNCSIDTLTILPYPIGITTAAMREAAFGATVRNQLVYDTLINENTYISNEYVYRMMLDDSTIITMGDTSDYVYQNFYNTMQSSNSAHYINAITAMDTNDLVTAQNELNFIADTTTIDDNRITVINIYLASWAIGNYTLTDDQIRTLYDIAYLDPATDGDAVYTARVMLNINPNDVKVKSALLLQQPKQDSKPNAVHVYPNPTKDNITIAFDQPISSNGIIEIWDIVGNKLLFNTIPQSTSKQIINVSGLTSGIYFYDIKVNGNKISSGKLIILNK